MYVCVYNNAYQSSLETDSFYINAVSKGSVRDSQRAFIFILVYKCKSVQEVEDHLGESIIHWAQGLYRQVPILVCGCPK